VTKGRVDNIANGMLRRRLLLIACCILPALLGGCSRHSVGNGSEAYVSPPPSAVAFSVWAKKERNSLGLRGLLCDELAPHETAIVEFCFRGRLTSDTLVIPRCGIRYVNATQSGSACFVLALVDLGDSRASQDMMTIQYNKGFSIAVQKIDELSGDGLSLYASKGPDPAELQYSVQRDSIRWTFSKATPNGVIFFHQDLYRKTGYAGSLYALQR